MTSTGSYSESPNCNSLLIRKIGDYGKFGIGPFGRIVEIDKTEGRFTADDAFPHPEQVETTYQEVGLQTFLNIQRLDNNISPTRGIKWNNQLTLHQEIGGTENHLARLNSDFSVYLTPNWQRFKPTLAVRAGIGTNIGAYKFFQVQSIGNLQNLRGFRRNRFCWQSHDLSERRPSHSLVQFLRLCIQRNGGILGFADQGRVWIKEEDSKAWHRSAGPGVWFNFFDYLLISATYGSQTRKSPHDSGGISVLMVDNSSTSIPLLWL